MIPHRPITTKLLLSPVFFEDFFELDGACVPDVDRVILRPNRDVLTVGGEGGASPVAARLKPLRTKCRTNLEREGVQGGRGGGKRGGGKRGGVKREEGIEERRGEES